MIFSKSATVSKLEPALRASFDPQEDITAYELALIYRKIVGGFSTHEVVSFTQDQWDGLPANIARHFKLIP